MRKMKSNLSFLLALLLLVLCIPANSQEDNNKEETFLGIGSGSRKISKFQKSPINPFHVDSTMQMEEIKYYLEPPNVVLLLRSGFNRGIRGSFSLIRLLSTDFI